MTAGVSVGPSITPAAGVDAVVEPVVVREPFVGAASFKDTPEDRALFFGRERERVELLNLVLSESLVVLLGRSGLGKSSLINARLLTDLRENRFFPIAARVKPVGARTVRPAKRGRDAAVVGATPDESSPTRSVLECVIAAARREQPEPVEIIDGRIDADLWDYFHAAKFKSGDRYLRPILVIDQFEELFTTYERGDPRRESFVDSLADLVRRRVPERVKDAGLRELDALPRPSDPSISEEVRAKAERRRSELLALLYEDAVPDVKVLLAIREDRMADLMSLRTTIPGILRSSLRLESLSVRSAREAIVEPTKQPTVPGVPRVEFSDGLVEQMLTQLAGEANAGKSEDLPLIEPLQLQILCRFLYEHPRSSDLITEDQLRKWGGMRKAIDGYYTSVLNKVAAVRIGPNGRRWWPAWSNMYAVNWPRTAAATLCEKGLIDFSEHRTSLNGPVIETRYGVAPKDLEVLVRERLVVEDPRPDTTAYELAHDQLVKPLRLKRLRRFAKRTAGVVGAVAAAFILPSFYSTWSAERQALGIAQDPAYRPEQRGEALVRLARTKNVAHGNFSGIDLTSAYLDHVDFDSATLRNARLTDGNYIGASFKGANLSNDDLSGAMFANAKMAGANLTGANASYTNFGGADLSNATLHRATLRGADFTSARLTGATITAATLDGARMDSVVVDRVDFAATAWWLASGWSDAAFSTLAGRFSPDSFVTSGAYGATLGAIGDEVRRGLDARNAANAAKGSGRPVDDRRDTTVLAASAVALPPELAYAKRARFIALNGTDLAAAYADVEHAYKSKDFSSVPLVLDTRAFILLRETWADDRSKRDNRRGDAYRDARAAARPYAGDDSVTLGERFYHLGLAYEGMLDTVPATYAFRRAAELRYVPTYERLFTPSALGQSMTNPAKIVTKLGPAPAIIFPQKVTRPRPKS